MEGVKDSFLDLERHRQQLEKNVVKLEASLDYWRKWDAEYEALKEDVLRVVARETSWSPSVAKGGDSLLLLERVKTEFESSVIDRKEIEEIFGSGGKSESVKTPQQVANLLDRRLDYVGKNISSLGKQLEDLGKKLEATLVVSNPGMLDEDGLPITDIIEHLDDEDKVVSSELLRPGEKQLQLTEVLQKAELTQSGASDKQTARAFSPNPSSAVVAEEDGDSGITSVKPSHDSRGGTTAQVGVSDGDNCASADEEDSAAFVNGASQTVPGHNGHDSDVDSDMNSGVDSDSTAESFDMIRMLKTAAADLDRDDSDGGMPNALEVGDDVREIVAIFQDLNDEEDSDDEFLDEEEDEWADTSDEDDEDDEEDQFGRSTRRTVTPEYERRMVEMKQRYGLDWAGSHSKGNGSAVDDESGSDADVKIGRIAVGEKSSPSSSFSSANREPPKRGILKSSSAYTPTTGPDQKKSTRFSDVLDIAKEHMTPTRSPASASISPSPLRKVAPFPSSPATTRKQASRFKQGVKSTAERSSAGKEAQSEPRAPVDDDASTGQGNNTIAESIIVRDDVELPANDEHDAEMRAIVDEYNDMRPRMIQKHVNFLEEDKSPIQPLEEEDSSAHRPSKFKSGMSRFKASRQGNGFKGPSE